MRLFILFLSFFMLLGCDRPNPEPEKLDPIYTDLEKEAQATESDLKQAEKDLEGFEKELLAVVPQTGQIKYAQKRITETNARITKLRQKRLYWKLRIESRKVWAREKYLIAFRKNEAWPKPEEYSEYQAQKKLEEAPRTWNAKERLEQARLSLGLKNSTATPEEIKKEH